ncbi:MAG: hypothetical protein ACE5GS_15725 [Kiloniellaceae bacterium]
MRIVKSVVCGYMGAVVGGLAVAVLAVALDLSADAAASAAVPAGIVCGALGLGWPWRRAVAVRIRRR